MRVSLGILLVYVLGAVLYWRWVAGLPALLALLFALCLAAVPESPIWLAGHRGVEPARRALTWLRGGSASAAADAVAAELEELLEMQAVCPIRKHCCWDLLGLLSLSRSGP